MGKNLHTLCDYVKFIKFILGKYFLVFRKKEGGAWYDQTVH